MGMLRYQMSEDIQKNIDAKLLYVTSSRYEGDWPSLKHSHYFTELFYVEDGGGSFIVEDETFPIVKHDLVIINPNIMHTEFSLDTTPLEYVILGVEGLSFSFGDSEEFKIINCSNTKKDLMSYFTAMLGEMENKEKNYELVCQNLLEILIVNLVRQTDCAFEIVSSQKTSKECSVVKRYIDSNYKDDISLDYLADMVHLNKFYFAHAFTKFYGLSPMNYLIEKRIQASKALLQSTDHNIADIAQLSGFSSQSYFAQSFKKNCGMTAQNYRKMVRKAQ